MTFQFNNKIRLLTSCTELFGGWLLSVGETGVKVVV